VYSKHRCKHQPYPSIDAAVPGNIPFLLRYIKRLEHRALCELSCALKYESFVGRNIIAPDANYGLNRLREGCVTSGAITIAPYEFHEKNLSKIKSGSDS
jgi:hypothetical protein